MPDRADSLAQAIGRAFRLHVVEEALPRVRHCVTALTPEQVWRRHGAKGNSIGNLLLHLEGNVRQWILCGIRGDPDSRQRDAEFAARESRLSPLELVDRLATTAIAAAEVVAATPADVMLGTRTFQARFEREVCGAILHVLEHFSGHAYQIYAWTKQMLGTDLRFWDL